MKKGIVFSDGGARGNPGPAAIGVLVCNDKGEALQKHHGELGIEEVAYFVDSELVARQLSGIYRIKSEHLKELVLKVKDKEKNFRRVTYQQVPRTHEKIKVVDRLVNLALDLAGA